MTDEQLQAARDWLSQAEAHDAWAKDRHEEPTGPAVEHVRRLLAELDDLRAAALCGQITMHRLYPEESARGVSPRELLDKATAEIAASRAATTKRTRTKEVG